MTLKFLLIIFTLFVAAPAAALVGARHYEPAGGFSFCPPDGWETHEVQGQKYKVHLVRNADGLAANIIAKDMDFDGTLEEFVDGNLRVLSELSKAGQLKNYKLLGRSELTTAAGAKTLKAVTEQEINGRLLRQTYYAFEGGAGRKIYLTCTVPASSGAEYDKALDESAKTFRLEGPSAPPKS